MRLFTIILLLFVTNLYALHVKADLLITPTRVVFKERDRVQELILVNTANEVRSYSLGWTELRQKENTSYEKIRKEDLGDFERASKFVRFSPRRITLQPGENQRVKLMVSRTSKMVSEEYRSHLKFTVIPASVLQQAEEEEVDGIKLKLNLFLNYSIPVVIKNTKQVPKLNISNIAFSRLENNPNPAQVSFTLSKTESISAIGDITILFKANGQPEFTPIGFNNNVSIYHENNRLNIVVPWTKPVPVQAGQVKIIYKGKQESGDTLLIEGLTDVN